MGIGDWGLGIGDWVDSEMVGGQGVRCHLDLRSRRDRMDAQCPRE